MDRAVETRSKKRDQNQGQTDLRAKAETNGLWAKTRGRQAQNQNQGQTDWGSKPEAERPRTKTRGRQTEDQN